MNIRRHSKVIALGNLRRTVRLGMKSLWLHRLRSLLTVLGIVFGVCSVIAMLAVGEGASYEAQQQIRQLGSTNIILRSIKPPEDQKNSQQQSFLEQHGLTQRDIDEIRATIPGVADLVPCRNVREYTFRLDSRVDCTVAGTAPSYPEVRNQRVISGRFFSSLEMENGDNVCLLDRNVALALFPIDDPLGDTILAGQHYYRVIGVMEPPGVVAQASGNGANDNGGDGGTYRIYIPLQTMEQRYGEITMRQRSGSFEAEKCEFHEVTVQVAEQDKVMETSAIIEDILARNHKKRDYEVVVPLQLLRQAERTKQIFNVVLGAIAAISLVVGGIGIMNIMLASVTERTREIGIRRALGARRRDIIVQFLIETVILSGAGGMIGVVLGILIPYLITYFADMRTIVSLWSPMIAFSISALVGVVFGIYPALRAADMDPVEALRHE